VPFITIANISRGEGIDFRSTHYVPRSYYDALSEARRPKSGDVLYSVTGSYGIVVAVPPDTEFCFQRHIALIRPGPALNSTFLLAVLTADEFRDQADAAATGVAQKTVSLGSLRKFTIPVPPLEIQQELAERLSSEESAIYANRELAARMAERVVARMLSMWQDVS
jgi:restriction endonuclease S subunit